MPPTPTANLALDPHLYERLARAAAERSLDPSRAVAEAVEAWLDTDAWHRAEIEAALAEADAGDFATDEEVEAAFAKWRVAGGG
jgi:RHH-type transcriptional regulator, rel operon repressor / antitoxin RelB